MLLAVTVFLSRAFEDELREPGFRTTRMLLSNYEPGSLATTMRRRKRSTVSSRSGREDCRA
jgi:hypothetical protein